MHIEPPPSHHPSNPDVRYEKSDGAVRPLYIFLSWILGITIASAVFAWITLDLLKRWHERNPERPVMAEAQDLQQPPLPQLQTREPLDLFAFKKEEAEILSTYGVVDKEKGAFRIPIEEAMRLTLLRGLPVAGRIAATETQPAKPAAPGKPAVKEAPKAAHP